MGISQLAAGYALHSLLFNNDFKILVIATKQDVARNLVQKVQFMHDTLPAFLKGKVVSNNKLSIAFANGSMIKAVSSSPDAARSEALSLLIMDECLDSETQISIRNKITGEIKSINISELYENNLYD